MSRNFLQRMFIWSLAALFFSTLPAGSSEVPSLTQGAIVTRCFGDVRNGAGECIEAGMQLDDGDVISAGKSSWCEVKWKSAIVRAWHTTAFQVQPSKNLLAVRQGNLRFFVNKNVSGSVPYEVRTPHYRMLVSDTTVSVTVSGSSEEISTFDNKVAVYDLQTNALVKSLTPGAPFCSSRLR